MDLASTGDYQKIFSTLADAGIDTYFPTSIYQEYPVVHGLGHEADLFPPPYGTATSEIYDLAREYGIKIAFSADLMFPLGEDVDAQNNPLKSIIDAGGADIIHSVVNYDEPAVNGIDPVESQKVYEYVKDLGLDIPVTQIHASVGESDTAAYLDSVRAHAEWADVVGFDVYCIGETVSGARTPDRPDELVRPAEALAEYADWLQAEFPDKQHVMALQGFELSDLYPDYVVELTSLDALSRQPTFMELREMLVAVQDVDMVYWWGASLQASENATIWQDILALSDQYSAGQLNTEMGLLVDTDTTADGLDEDAVAGDFVGVNLFAEEVDAQDSVTYSVDDSRFELDAQNNLRVAENAKFDFETESKITIEATAESTDGTMRTIDITLDVADKTDIIEGTQISDALIGAENSDAINAGDGDDAIVSLGGNDTINGGGGSDFAYAGDGDDVMRGGAGVDVLIGEAGNDTIEGGDGVDFVFGGSGNDRLEGNAGDDQMIAESGNNTFIGGRGSDQLFASSGADSFEFAAGDGTDYVFDFDVLNDKIVFTGDLVRDDLQIKSYNNTVSTVSYDGGTVFLIDVGASTMNDLVFDFA
nr:calcium-binding protein [Aquicoccus sp. G2-2]MEA1114610.1 calcium-binding protein [Aquicoccus sp. G2-2]